MEQKKTNDFLNIFEWVIQYLLYVYTYDYLSIFLLWIYYILYTLYASYIQTTVSNTRKLPIYI